MTNSHTDIEVNNSTTIKQAMILAAGKGTRMRPLTLETPKPLIDVSGQPLIVWHILALKAAGIEQITINCSWLADKLLASLGDGSQFGVNLRWSVEGEEPLETAGGIAKALHDGKLDNAPFILVNGDVWTTFDFSQLTSFALAEDKLAHLLLIDNPEHNPMGDFVLLDGLAKRKVSVEESQQRSNPTTQNENLSGQEAFTFSGLSIVHPNLLQDVNPTEKYPLAPLLIKAMKNQQISAQKINEKWIDVGTPERLELVNHYVANELAEGMHKGLMIDC